MMKSKPSPSPETDSRSGATLAEITEIYDAIPDAISGINKVNEQQTAEELIGGADRHEVENTIAFFAKLAYPDLKPNQITVQLKAPNFYLITAAYRQVAFSLRYETPSTPDKAPYWRLVYTNGGRVIDYLATDFAHLGSKMARHLIDYNSQDSAKIRALKRQAENANRKGVLLAMSKTRRGNEQRAN